VFLPRGVYEAREEGGISTWTLITYSSTSVIPLLFQRERVITHQPPLLLSGFEGDPSDEFAARDIGYYHVNGKEEKPILK